MLRHNGDRIADRITNIAVFEELMLNVLKHMNSYDCLISYLLDNYDQLKLSMFLVSRS